MAVQNLYVDSAGDFENWDVPLFTDHYLEVDETSQDGDTSYIADSGLFAPNGSGPKDSFNIDAWPHGNKLITKIEVVFWAKYVGGTVNKCRPFVRLDSSNTEGDTENLTTDWVEYTQELAKPGGGNWQYTDLADLQVGVIASANTAPKLGSNVRVTQVYVKVTYIEEFAQITSDSEIYDPYSTEFYLSKLTSDLSGGTDFNAQLLENLDVATSYYHIALDDNATEVCYAFTEPNVPSNTDWETGAIAVQVVAWVVNPDEIYLSVSGSRVDSDGVVQETTEATAEQFFDEGTSAETYSFTIPSYNWSTGNYGDRLRINYQFRNSVAQGTSVRIRIGYEDSNIGTFISLHGIETISSDSHIITGIPSLDFTGLTIAEVLKLIDDNDDGISINQNKDALATMLQKIAATNNINIGGLSLAGIIQKFDIYYS